ncbi:MAG: HD domain-containing protein [Clostridiales bacterium]|nr:HD domain-containing protein [Clostridiales bacterium]
MIKGMKTMNEELLMYIQTNIIPRYHKVDKAHDVNHIRHVIRNCMYIAKEYDVDKNILYTAAAYHDLGLEVERERHEVFSRDMMCRDKRLDDFFNQEEKDLIADAILTHRASSKAAPKTIYGKILADADRDLVPVRIIERTILYSLEKFPNSSRTSHFMTIKDHIAAKYGPDGYVKLWLDTQRNNKGLKMIRTLMSDESRFERVFDYYFDKHTNDG